jgi:hypothetical protein
MESHCDQRVTRNQFVHSACIDILKQHIDSLYSIGDQSIDLS